MPCVVISPKASRIAQLMADQAEVKAIMQRIWGIAPGDWEHEIQHMLMRKAEQRSRFDPVSVAPPTITLGERVIQVDLEVIRDEKPIFQPLALEPPTRREGDLLNDFLNDYNRHD